MVGGLKFLRRLFVAPAMARYVVAEKLPDPSVQSDDRRRHPARAGSRDCAAVRGAIPTGAPATAPASAGENPSPTLIYSVERRVLFSSLPFVQP
jgi:hypothetical protein